MKKPVVLFLTLFLMAGLLGRTQSIVYSEPDRDDSRTLNFEVVGKLNGKILVYKNYRDLHYIATYDADMKMLEKNRLDFLSERILSTEFIQYAGHVYLFYQYQKKSVLYCMAAKLDENGKKIGEPVLLDTTNNISFAVNNKIYSLLSSEDKQKIMLFKVNSRSDRAHILTTCLFDKELTLLKKTRMVIDMPQRNDFLSEFSLDNDGDMACIRASGTASNDNINKITLITREAMKDHFSMTDLRLNGLFLDDIRIKVDNINKHYVITSFYSKTRRGNIEGLYYYLWDKPAAKELITASTAFSEELRSDAKSDGNVKTAFNDFFLKNIVVRKDGGFLVIAESAYTTSRGTSLSRWDYLYGSPYWGAQSDYYYYNTPGYYPWRSPFINTTLTRYFADNIAVLSFEPNGKMEWSNILRKSQYDDNNDNFIGFGLLNSGDQLHFLFNVQEKRDMILTDQSVAPAGQINRNPTFKNLDKGYDFMPRHSKQVGSRQIVIPCMYRGFTCFAKVEF